MTLANQSGWFVLAGHDAIGEWDGGDEVADLVVTIPGEPPRAVQAQSATGHGILTWTIPYVFRTPPGWNLLCRGPANYVKDGVAPLEGLVETDWSLASFSMNWKFTRPGRVEWRKGEPVAMLVPQRRGDLEEFSARKDDLRGQPELYWGYTRGSSSVPPSWRRVAEGPPRSIERHYFSGRTVAGVAFDGHQKAHPPPVRRARRTSADDAVVRRLSISGRDRHGPRRGRRRQHRADRPRAFRESM